MQIRSEEGAVTIFLDFDRQANWDTVCFGTERMRVVNTLLSTRRAAEGSEMGHTD